MRTIKFRAFDKTNKRMIVFDDFWACDEYQLLGWVINPNSKLESEGDYCLEWDSRNLEIMQFTGLHDKNGKEIYEGDVIKVRFINEDSCMGTTMEEIYIVKWNEKKLGFCFSDGKYHPLGSHNGDFYIDFIKNEEYEVIGNIYENGDLLNGK